MFNINFRGILKSFGRGINALFPKNKYKIMFESNSDYCDNTRAVYDYVVANPPAVKNYKLVWCVRNPKEFDCSKLPEATVTSFHSRRYFLQYLYHLYTSKTVLYTHFVPPFCSAKTQTVVNLWHGTPLKSIKGHCHSHRLFNYVLSPSPFCNALIADSFEMGKSDEKKLMLCGYPRNDVLFSKREVLSLLSIKREEFKKVILWMPTFRKPLVGGYQDGEGSATGIPLIDDLKKLSSLNDELGRCGLLLIIKLHPGQDLSGVKLSDLSNIKMLTNKNLAVYDIQPYELVSAADVLLTDYSSIYFDFLLLDRPIGFIIDDFDSYDKKRGFTVAAPLEYMPGQKIKTAAELYGFLKDIEAGKDDFTDERHRINDLVNQYKDGNSSKRFWKMLGVL